ncbi:sigma-70 family RNA polymerase sigma factor [Blautia sp. RD014234]|nr:sigma-70 family RNA polymerase sigma factor [Blautia parvula]
MSEKKILKNIRSGRQDSLEILIKEYYRDIYAYCYCRVEDRQTAQDLTQDVFLRFLQNLDSYEHTGKLKNYLYVTAGNLIKDHYKKERKSFWRRKICSRLQAVFLPELRISVTGLRCRKSSADFRNRRKS